MSDDPRIIGVDFKPDDKGWIRDRDLDNILAALDAKLAKLNAKPVAWAFRTTDGTLTIEIRHEPL